MHSWDESTLYFFNRYLKCDFLDSFFVQVSDLGLWTVVILVFVVVRFFQEKTLKYPLPAFIATWFLADATAGYLKHLFGRPRPAVTLPWVVVMEKSFSDSLPSGHAIIAMAFAIILNRYYPKFSIVFYTIVGLIGLSRLYLGVHYLTDVLSGYMIGAALGYVVIKLETKISFLRVKGKFPQDLNFRSRS